MLVADRFIALNGRTIDLACGEPVAFRRLPPADRAEQVRWSERCATVTRTGNEAAQVLADYGSLNDGGRFEAYRAKTPRVCGRSSTGRPVPTPLLEQIGDLFDTACLGEPRVVRLPLPGGGLSPALLDTVAREARLNGFVPLSVDLLVNAWRRHSFMSPLLQEIVDSRHVLLLTHGPISCTGRGWCATRAARITACPVALARVLLTSGARSARPNILLLVAPTRTPPAVRPPCLATMSTTLARRAPGVPYPAVSVALQSTVAAEAHERYQLVGGSDIVRLRARAADAIRDARAGRPLHAEHRLRELLGSLVRRDEAAAAAWVALNLGCLLLDRGRALDAARAFDTARTQYERANDVQGAAHAAVHLGLAWTDDGRLTEAEAACRTAATAACEVGLGEVGTEANLALARCLYWQGRFDEATVLSAALVDAVEADAPAGSPGPSLAGRPYPVHADERQPAVVREALPVEAWGEPSSGLSLRRGTAAIDGDRRVRATALAARLALTRGDLRAASARAALALEVATRTGRPVDACVAHTALAGVSAALGDLDGVLNHVRGGLAAAKAARAPLRALRLRLLACDSLRMGGRQAEAARWLRHLARLDAGRVPGLLRARLQIVLSADRRTPAGSETAGTAAALVTAACPWRPARPSGDLAEEVAAVLRVCHEMEDEESALGRVCDAVRERVRAVAVAVVGRNGAAPSVLARSGPNAGRSTIAERVLDTGLAVAATATSLGLESAAPIRYGGGVIGAVACRWPADALVDGGRAGCVIAAAAAATAPHVRTLLDRAPARPAAGGGDDTELVGVSEAIQALRKAALRAAGAPFPVLIEGESGSGKELVARAIHRDGARRARRFCALNCAALTDDLLEAELFGHARGAFTGAIAERVGLVEEADGGTLFLDEVADLSARAQAKLLRVLQDGEVRRVGENFARHVDARLIAATNRRLDAAVSAGTFRRDLFYRLNVVHIDVPPLRDRPDDIPVLAAHFWRRATERIGSRATLAPAAVAALAAYDWPGNVRELQNVMAALAVSAPRRGSVSPACLPGAVARAETRHATLEEARRVFERRFVQAALARAGGHRGRAASAIGISRQGLAKLIARLGLAARSAD